MLALPQQPVRTPKYNVHNKPKQGVNKDFFFHTARRKEKNKHSFEMAGESVLNLVFVELCDEKFTNVF